MPEDNEGLVERVALALYECDGGSRDQFQEETTTTRPAYYALACAAIASLQGELQEPTSELTRTPEPCRQREGLVELLRTTANQAIYCSSDHAKARENAKALLTASPAELQPSEAIPDWKLVHAVRSGALNALRHAGVTEGLFATVAAATYAPIRAALRTAAPQDYCGIEQGNEAVAKEGENGSK